MQSQSHNIKHFNHVSSCASCYKIKQVPSLFSESGAWSCTTTTNYVCVIQIGPNCRPYCITFTPCTHARYPVMVEDDYWQALYLPAMESIKHISYITMVINWLDYIPNQATSLAANVKFTTILQATTFHIKPLHAAFLIKPLHSLTSRYIPYQAATFFNKPLHSLSSHYIPYQAAIFLIKPLHS